MEAQKSKRERERQRGRERDSASHAGNMASINADTDTIDPEKYIASVRSECLRVVPSPSLFLSVCVCNCDGFLQ